MSLAFFPMFPDDFEADTAHLTLAEDGAYNRLLRLCWRTPGCSVPADRKWVYRRLRANSPEDQAVIETVISEFFKEIGGRLSNARLSKEWLAANEAHERRKNAGSKGGSAKALKTKKTKPSNATAMLKQPEPQPEPEISSVELARTPADDFRAKCFEAAGLDPQEAMAVPGLVSTVSLEHLIRDRNNPCDPEMDVLPAIQTCAATLRKRGQTLTNWSYCREAAIRNRDQRLAGNPTPVAQPAHGNASGKPAGKRANSSFAAAGMRVAAQIHSRGRNVDRNERDAGSDAADQLAAMWAGHRGPDGAGTGGKPGAMALNHERADGEEGSGGVGVGTGGDSLRPEAA